MVRARRAPPDGRVNNGGPRQGNPGTPYPNRSDLRAQPVTTVPGQPYGQAGAQAAAQKAVPMAGAPTATPLAPGQGPMPTGGPAPGSGGDLYRTTERPNEPVTQGLTSGPGAGPEALSMTTMPSRMTDPTAIAIQALYNAHPSAELAAVLADLR